MKDEILMGNIPIMPNKVQVYDKKPSPSAEVFDVSLPVDVKSDCSDVLVFYNSDIELIAELDNSDSDASTSYSRSITEGFSASVGVGLSFEMGWEISAKIVKTNVKFGINISFTAEWSNSRTETIKIDVPAHKRAYLYQAVIKCQKMRLDHRTGKLEYIGKEGKLNTDTYKTTDSIL